MSSKPNLPPLTKWQRRVLGDLRAQAKNQSDLLKVGKQERDEDGNTYVRFTIETGDLPAPTSDGVHFKPTEQFVLYIEPTDDHPPYVLLTDPRFIGIPHVLSGIYLCLYLDESREWDPHIGVNGKNGVLNRLWDWMDKAARNDFNPKNALFHAVGGVPHVSPGAPSIVIRDLPPHQRRVQSLLLHKRTDRRYDLIDPATATPSIRQDAAHIPVFWADSDMPLGAGHHYLGELLGLIRHPRPIGLDAFVKPIRLPRARPTRAVTYHAVRASRDYVCPLLPNHHPQTPQPPPYETTPDAALFTALVASASRNPRGTPQHLILAVPHPVAGPHHLLALRLTPSLADDLRDHTRDRTTPLIAYEPDRINGEAPIAWSYVSDERPEVTTRRDNDRPVEALRDKTVVILGCGGLGSWIAEFVARAGAKHMIVSDQGRITGGLLVRQNYVENDNGAHKALALKARLEAISDAAKVEAHGPLTTAELASLATDTDLIIDATISLKMTQQLDTIATKSNRKATVAQVATDAQSSTLGLAIINPPGDATITNMDEQLRDHIRATGTLERYRNFWDEPDPEDEIIPTRGCSAPTFHGSAADMAALAGGLLNVITKHLTHTSRGSHLIALPHSGITPAHQYVPHPPPTPPAPTSTAPEDPGPDAA